MIHCEILAIDNRSKLFDFINKYNYKYKINHELILLFSEFKSINNSADLYKTIIFDKFTYRVVSVNYKRLVVNDFVTICSIETKSDTMKKEISECLEGTSVSFYYHNHKWNMSTTSIIEASKCFWKNKDKSIQQMVLETIQTSYDAFLDLHDKDKIYIYDLIHFENKHLIDYSYRFGRKDYRILRHVLTRNKQNMDIDYECPEQKLIQSNHKNIIPKVIFDNYSMLDKYNEYEFNSNHTSKIKYKGLVIMCKETESIVLLLTSSYTMYNMIDVKKPRSINHYMTLYKLNLLTKYFDTFDTEAYFNNINIVMMINSFFRILSSMVYSLFIDLYILSGVNASNPYLYQIKEHTEYTYHDLSSNIKKMLFILRGKYNKKRILVTPQNIYNHLKSQPCEDLIHCFNDLIQLGLYRQEVPSSSCNRHENYSKSDISLQDIQNYIIMLNT